MSDRRALNDAHRDLNWLQLTWGDLAHSRLKGTPRTWLHQGPGTPRHPHPTEPDPALTIPGQPAPLHLDVLDAIIDTTRWADTHAGIIAETLHQPPLPHPTGLPPDPRPWLAYINDHIDELSIIDTEHTAQLIRHAHLKATHAARLLGLLTGGQVLDADCPYCRLSRVLTVIAPDLQDPLIVCMGRCWADDNRRGHFTWRGRVAWSRDDWPRLARMICEHRDVDKDGRCTSCGDTPTMPLFAPAPTSATLGGGRTYVLDQPQTGQPESGAEPRSGRAS